MLIRFRVENFRSIKEQQEFSLVASTLSENQENLVHIDRYDLDVLRTSAIYGSNASGKSTVVAAFDFMETAVKDSQRIWRPDGGIPRTPFVLAPEMTDAPSLFAVDLLIQDVRYEYGFVVDDVRVREEWLFAYPRGRRQEWFTRNANRPQEFVFSRLLTGENRAISGFTRANSLFLSAAAQNNHEMLAPIYHWFSSLVVLDARARGGTETASAQVCLDDRWRTSVLEVLRAADLGITDLEIREEEVTSFAKRMNLDVDDYPQRAAAGVQFRHRAAGGSTEISLPFELESDGTRTMFGLAGFIVLTLAVGGVMVVDELDRSLHPHLAIQIVNLFNRSATNPKNAQLIFNTHDTNLLDTTVLRRDQIWFTEKGNDGATRLFPLTDFRARKYENLERGYLQGRYGAVPSVRTPDLLAPST